MALTCIPDLWPHSLRWFRRFRGQGLSRDPGEGSLRHRLCPRGVRLSCLLPRALAAGELRRRWAGDVVGANRERAPADAGLPSPRRGARRRPL